MAVKLHPMKNVLQGSEVRYTSDYLYTQYGKNANKKELAYIKGIVISLKRIGLSAETYANVAWDNGLTYQVPVEFLEITNGSKIEVAD